MVIFNQLDEVSCLSIWPQPQQDDIFDIWWGCADVVAYTLVIKQLIFLLCGFLVDMCVCVCIHTYIHMCTCIYLCVHVYWSTWFNAFLFQNTNFCHSWMLYIQFQSKPFFSFWFHNWWNYLVLTLRIKIIPRPSSKGFKNFGSPLFPKEIRNINFPNFYSSFRNVH